MRFSNYYSYKCYYKCLSMAFPSLRWEHLPLCTLFHTLQTSLDSFVSHPSLDKHRQEMNVVLQWFTPYWKHLLSKKSIQSSFGFTCLLFSLALADMYLFIWLFPTSTTHLVMFEFCLLTWIVSHHPICLSVLHFVYFFVFNSVLFFPFTLLPILENPTFLHVSLLLCYLY